MSLSSDVGLGSSPKKHISFLKIIAINVFIFIAVCISLCLFLEIWARVKYPADAGARQGVWHMENALYSDLAKQLPNYKDHYESLAKLTQNGFKYYDYYVYSLAPIKTKTIVITDYFSSRHVPDSVPLGKAKTIIWFFGGSTLQNLDSADDRTIVNQVARELKSQGIEATLLNFSVAAYQSSVEFVKFTDLLRRVPSHELPTVVVFYDGFNDPWYGLHNGPGNMPTTFANISEIFKKKNHRLMFYTLLYDYLLKHSVYWNTQWHSRVLASMHQSDAQAANITNKESYLKALDETIGTYLKNVYMSDAVCKTGNIKCLHIIQPMLFTKKPLHSVEARLFKEQLPELTFFYQKFYEQVILALSGYENFVNMAHVLDNRPELDFYDIGHTSPLGTSEVLGKRIANEIIKKFSRQ